MSTLSSHRKISGNWHLFPGLFFCLSFVVRAGFADGNYFLPTLFDDAMISMTYAKTFVNTGELVWFPGADRVQGFSNPGWTLVFILLQYIEKFSFSSILLAQLLGIIILLFLAKNIEAMVMMVNPHANRLHSRLVSGSIMFLYPLVFWTLRGMEVGVLALILTSIIHISWKSSLPQYSSSSQRYMSLVAILSAFGVLIRIDFVVLIFALVFSRIFRLRRISPLDKCLIYSSLLSVLLVLLLQWQYYGSFLPNTYYLKLEGTNLGQRIYRGTLNIVKHFNIFLPLISFTYLSVRKSLKDQKLLDLQFCVLGAFLYSIWVGGDAWEWSGMTNRYISTVLPLVCCLVGSLDFQTLLQRFSAMRRMIKIILSLGVLGSFIGLYTNPVRFEYIRALLYLVLFLFLALLSLYLIRRIQVIANRQLISSLFILILCVNLSGSYYLIRDGGIHVTDDRHIAITSKYIAREMSGKTSTALFWAGTPGYYLPGRLLDFLGKNDAGIARLDPNGDFWPGHDKHDFKRYVCTWVPDYIFSVSGDLGIPDTLVSLNYSKMKTPYFIVWKREYMKISQTKSLIPCT